MDYIAWVQKFKSGERWFDRLKAKKGSPDRLLYQYAIGLHKFSTFKESDPDTILAEYKRSAREDLDEALDQIEVDLDLFINWLVENDDVKRSSAAQRHTAIRSWLKYNAKSLKGIPSPETYSETIPPHTIEEIREIVATLDPREKVAVLIMKDSGVSRAEAVKLTYGQMRKELSEGKKFVHLKVHRTKEHVDYDTFLGPDAVNALSTWLDMRVRRGEELTDNSPLVIEKDRPWNALNPSGLSQMFERISAKVGFKVRTHKIRKFFETYMALGVRHPIILKYWMGHKVKGGKSDIDARYIIPPVTEQRALYMQAYKNIDLTPKADEYSILLAATKAQLEGMAPEVRRRFAKELLAHLNEGWQVVHNLQNGRVIVKRLRNQSNLCSFSQ